MNRLAVCCAAVLFSVAAGGCFKRPAPDPPAISGETAFEIIGEHLAAKSNTGTASAPAASAASATAQTEKSWIDGVDIDKVLNNGWLLAGVFLLVQWFEIWYYNRTGRKSKTIDAAEAAMQPKLGIIQRVLYRLWRFVYFWRHKDKKDPDKEEEKKK